MASELPTIPWLVFTRLEPLSLLLGFLGPVVDSTYFISSQIPFTYTNTAQRVLLDSVVSHDATAKLLALQLGNTYGLLGLLGVLILTVTSELKVVRAYLWALWIGDIGHVGFTVYAMGWKGTTEVSAWNAVVFGNVAFTAFLFAVRSAYFLGWFEQKDLVADAADGAEPKSLNKTRSD